MDKESVCRMCLQFNVKMYSLQSNPLQTYFEETLGVNVSLKHKINKTIR